MPESRPIILVVDDSQTLRRLANEYLSQLNLTVQTATNVTEALDLARGCAPDLILSDIVMPGQDGYTLWEWLIVWAKEVHYISWIVWKTLFIKLPAIERINKKTQSTFKRIWTTRKATRSTSETSQIMTEFSIISFD